MFNQNHTDENRSTNSSLDFAAKKPPENDGLSNIDLPMAEFAAPEIGGEEHSHEIARLGKDELNLIEHPFASLWKNESNAATIFHEWEARHPISGKMVGASWRVEGSPSMGLPNTSDERIYLVLMELTREAGFKSSTIYFTRYEVLRRLDWPDNKKYYEMLLQAFERLASVTITARNSFWDPSHKVFRNVAFGLLDLYNIASEKPGRKKKQHQNELPLSYFKWNDVLFQSFQNGYIRSLDLEFALSLNGDIALRLYRYLDKKSYDARRVFEIELAVLCQRHLGMRPSPYPSKYKERLASAHDELITRGFLEAVRYEPMSTKKAEKICYIFAPRRPAALSSGASSTNASATSAPAQTLSNAKPDEQDGALWEASIAGGGPPMSASAEAPSASGLLGFGQHTLNFDSSSALAPAAQSTLRPSGAPTAASEHAALLKRMTALKVSPEVARDLLQNYGAPAIALQLACLADREPRDAAATFVKSVRESWEAPEKYFGRLKAVESAQNVQTEQDSIKISQAREGALKRQETARQDEENARLDEMWQKLDAKTRQKLEIEIKAKLGFLGQSGRAKAAETAFRRSAIRQHLAEKSS